MPEQRRRGVAAVVQIRLERIALHLVDEHAVEPSIEKVGQIQRAARVDVGAAGRLHGSRNLLELEISRPGSGVVSITSTLNVGGLGGGGVCGVWGEASTDHRTTAPLNTMNLIHLRTFPPASFRSRYFLAAVFDWARSPPRGNASRILRTMSHGQRHPSDQTLLLALDRELSARRRAAVDRHLRACASCRARSLTMASVADGVSQLYRGGEVATSTTPLRRRLQTEMTGMGAQWDRSIAFRMRRALATPPLAVRVAASVALIALLLSWMRSAPGLVSVTTTVEAASLPIRALTPGAAARYRPRGALCRKAPGPIADRGLHPSGRVAAGPGWKAYRNRNTNWTT